MADEEETDFTKVAARHAAKVERPSAQTENLPVGIEKALAMKSATAALERLSHTSATTRAYEQALEALRPIEIGQGMQKIAEVTRIDQERMRRALGPFEDIKRLAVAVSLPRMNPELSHVLETMQRATERFRVPEMKELARLSESVFDQLREAQESFEWQSRAIAQAMEQMRSPWLDTENQAASARAFAALQGLGHMLDGAGTFEDRITALVRDHLGDWRGNIAWPDGIEDIDVRLSFYVERGYDTGLTDFPAPAFEEGTTIARLNRPVPRGIEIEEYEIPARSQDEEHGFQRTNKAHNRLLRFEAHLRHFIDERMRAQFGSNWTRHRIPNDVRKNWMEKKAQAQQRGEPDHPLIAYADFTDYEKIIVRSDNWRDVFQNFFGRRESLQESFRRLYPVRLCTMHARILTQDDELLLFVEVKRILTAIGVVKEN